eukprot:m.294557 g.294557  ORF g.294557 m.294557 type:complete len:477 (-) comp16257_c0_seq2:350-1780(-)
MSADGALAASGDATQTESTLQDSAHDSTRQGELAGVAMSSDAEEREWWTQNRDRYVSDKPSPNITTTAIGHAMVIEAAYQRDERHFEGPMREFPAVVSSCAEDSSFIDGTLTKVGDPLTSKLALDQKEPVELAEEEAAGPKENPFVQTATSHIDHKVDLTVIETNVGSCQQSILSSVDKEEPIEPAKEEAAGPKGNPVQKEPAEEEAAAPKGIPVVHNTPRFRCSNVFEQIFENHVNYTPLLNAIKMVDPWLARSGKFKLVHPLLSELTKEEKFWSLKVTRDKNAKVVTDDDGTVIEAVDDTIVMRSPGSAQVEFPNNGCRGRVTSIAVTRYEDIRIVFTVDAIGFAQMFKNPPCPGVGVFCLQCRTWCRARPCDDVVLAAGSGRVFVVRRGKTIVSFRDIKHVGTDHGHLYLEEPAKVIDLAAGGDMLFLLTSSVIRIRSALGDCRLLAEVPLRGGPVRSIWFRDRTLFVSPNHP